VHEDTLTKLADRARVPEQDSRIIFPVKPKIDQENPGSPNKFPGYEIVHRGLGGSPFKLVNYDTRRDLKPSIRPKLETNKTQFGTDCHLHTYGKGGSRTDFPHLKSKTVDYIRSLHPEINVNMVKIPVSLFDGGSCNNGLCDMKTRGAPDRLCDHISDLGAPILCGAEQKVTYLADPGKGNACNHNFKAYHVPHFVGDIQKHVPIS
jgi:hypothetical protein